jgi:hypothetical protein
MGRGMMDVENFLIQNPNFKLFPNVKLKIPNSLENLNLINLNLFRI